jgi:hypothetical protein
MSQIISQHKGTVPRRKDVKGIYGEIYWFFKMKVKPYYITAKESERRGRGISKDLDNE